MSEHRFPYRWKISDGYPAQKNGLKVFSTFACGGGSTMGYKLAGFEVLGCLEIDPEIIAVYKANHKPKLAYNQDIREFVKRDDLPAELFSLDILDGSPPCSTFSMSGSREGAWGVEKVFREGQAKQRLDDLFFEWIALVGKLRPKVAIAENVKGMLAGNAKGYVKEVVSELKKIGYTTQVFLLNAATMGVPQKRERVFFICRRDDLQLPALKMAFNEKPILFGEVKDEKDTDCNLPPAKLKLWPFVQKGDINLSKAHIRCGGKGSFFSSGLLYDDDVCSTITADSSGVQILYPGKRSINDREIIPVGTFPSDYNFLSVRPKYLIGMSVPPVMVAQIATQIYEQWFMEAGNDN